MVFRENLKNRENFIPYQILLFFFVRATFLLCFFCGADRVFLPPRQACFLQEVLAKCEAGGRAGKKGENFLKKQAQARSLRGDPAMTKRSKE